MNPRSVLRATNGTTARYSLRSHASSSVPLDEPSERLTSYFNVRKRHNVFRSEKNTDVEQKRCCQRGANVIHLSSHNSKSIGTGENSAGKSQAPRPVPYLPLGEFSWFSPELLQTVIDHLPVDSLCKLCECSGAFSREILSYLLSSCAQQRFLKETLYCSCKKKVSSNVDHFYSWGSLIQAATSSFPLKCRLSLLSKFYLKNAVVVDSATGWGRLFAALLEGLDFDDKLIFLDYILSMDEGSLRSQLNMVIEESPGSYPHCEVEVRRLLRGFFLDNCRFLSVYETAFWISAIIRTQRTASARGRLLFLLYGPLKDCEAHEKVIDWRILVDTAVTSYNDSVSYLKPLSDALFFLANSKFLPAEAKELAWNETEMFNVIEELTTSPEPWSFDNFATLILHRPCLIPLTIVPRVMNGFVEEAGQLFNTLKTLTYRWEMNGSKILGKYLSYAMHAMPPFERCSFIASVHRAFSNQLQEHLVTAPPAQIAFGEEIRAARSNSPLFRLLERFV